MKNMLLTPISAMHQLRSSGVLGNVTHSWRSLHSLQLFSWKYYFWCWVLKSALLVLFMITTNNK